MDNFRFKQNSQQLININLSQQTRWFLGAGVGSEVLLSGGHNIGGLSRDNGAIGVGDESSVGESGSGVGESSIGVGETSGIGDTSNRVDHTSGSSELGLGSGDSGLIDGDNGAVGVSHQTSVGVAGGIGVGKASGVSHGGNHGVDGATGSSEGSLGGLDLQGVDGDHGAVRVANQLGGGGSDTGSENLRGKYKHPFENANLESIELKRKGQGTQHQ